MEIKNIFYLVVMLIIIFNSGCKKKDLRSEELISSGINPEKTEKGKKLLKKAVELQNLNTLAGKVYQVKASDEWNKQMGLNINPWPGDNGSLLEFKMAFNTFDSQVTWIKGDMEGQTFGLQSWQLYEVGVDSVVKKIEDKNLKFIIPTMHYFLELPYRLAHAPIVSYMGQEEINNTTYERVFVTWQTPEPNEHDQYIVYINKSSGFVERTSYTIRNNYMWTPGNFFGTAVYGNFIEKEGITFPGQIDVYPFDNTDKKKVHSFKVRSLKINNFDEDELYPISGLPRIGDEKTSETSD